MSDEQGVVIRTKSLLLATLDPHPAAAEKSSKPPYADRRNAAKGGLFMSKNPSHVKKKNIFKKSIEELKNVPVLAICGVMAALAVALKFTATIDLGQYIRIGFSNLPGILVSALFGPSVGGIFFGVMDVVKFFIKPDGVYFPGFTISAALSGVIYGLVLYQKPVTLPRTLLSVGLNKLIVTVGVNTLWLNIMYQPAFMAILPARILAAAVMLPIDTVITYAILKILALVYQETPYGQKQAKMRGKAESKPENS